MISNAITQRTVWHVLSIDAVLSVNQMTEKALGNTHFLGKGIAVLKASSVQVAKQILTDNDDIAVILLDTMNDGLEESLSFVHFIRVTLKNYRTRIILRTGYPDSLPEISLIENYEIDGYTSKEAMPAVQIKIAVMTAIRAYHQIMTTTEMLRSLAGSIAHETRNPLAQVKYTLDAIKNIIPVPLDNAEPLAISHEQSQDIFQLVQQGLTSIKRGERIIVEVMNEVGNKPIDPKTFSYLAAAKTTQKAIDESAETLSVKNRVCLTVVKDFIFKIEETLYLFILFNLIKNALYYFKDYPQARLTITVDGNTNTIKVRDTGPGISPLVLDRLFSSFVSVGKEGGTGLGLAYCKRTMQAFGGDITCDSIVNEFTEFTLSFPKIEAQELDAYNKERLERARPYLQGKTVLIADEFASIRKAVRSALQYFACEIDEAENGQHAIELLQAKSYDIALFDLNMPVLDGYAVTEKIRSGIITGVQNLPIVAHSSDSSFIAKIKSQRIGINGFISKPCTQLELIDTLCKAIEHEAKKVQVKSNRDVLNGKTVIIADDDELNRQYMMSILQLENLNITVLEAQNGEDVLALLQKSKVDAVLIDMIMRPGMGGVEATQAIRAGHTQSEVPIIALTANSSNMYIEEAKSAGMNDFLTKPVETNLLLAKLIQHIDGKSIY